MNAINHLDTISDKIRKVIGKAEKRNFPGDPEFINLLNILLLKLSDERDCKKIEQAELLNKKYRVELASNFFGKPISQIHELIAINPHERRQLCNDNQINPYVFRTLFDYNSYSDCFWIYSTLSPALSFNRLNVLDFGCLASDYGFFFGKLGSNVTICDFKELVEFASYRLSRAKIKVKKVCAPADYDELTNNQELIFFGEVLEHLKDPYILLEHCVKNKVKVIYTTCYPYGNEAYFNYPGHTKEAENQAQQCIDLMRSNYNEISFEKDKRLWISFN